jgi:hypothetical protein
MPVSLSLDGLKISRRLEYRPAVLAEITRLSAPVDAGYSGSTDKDLDEVGDRQGIGRLRQGVAPAGYPHGRQGGRG